MGRTNDRRFAGRVDCHLADSSQYAALLPDDVHIPIDAWINKPLDADSFLKTIRHFLV
jgi:hypothetical protein